MPCATHMCCPPCSNYNTFRRRGIHRLMYARLQGLLGSQAKEHLGHRSVRGPGASTRPTVKSSTIPVKTCAPDTPEHFSFHFKAAGSTYEQISVLVYTQSLMLKERYFHIFSFTLKQSRIKQLLKLITQTKIYFSRSLV